MSDERYFPEWKGYDLEIQIEKLNRKIEELERKCRGYEDDIRNLQYYKQDA